MALPILAGLAIGAAMGGGIAALQKKDVLQGALMGAAGGALGGVLMPGAAGAAGAAGAESSLAGTLAGEAGVQSLAQGSLGEAMKVGALDPVMLESGTSGLQGAAMEVGGLGIKPGIATGAIPPTTTGGVFGNLGGSGGIGNFISQNKGALGGGALGGMLAGYKEEEQPSQGNIYDMTFSQERNPLFGQRPGESAFINQRYATNRITPVEDYKPTMTAANGGIIALAEGGQPGAEIQRYERPVRQMSPEVAAYNQQLMERANQQYNVNLRPAPNQVPGSVGYIPPPAPVAPAPAEDSISGLTFNPITRQYEGKFKAPGSKDRSSMFDGGMDEDRYADLDARYMRQNNDGGGAANGGLMSSYAAGGISSLGSYSDGGQLLKGPGDGVSDDIPARIGARQPARLADGEFVVPARIVSELGNGSTDAGAKQLYAMMDRVQKNRKKTVGKGKVAVDAKARKLLPA
jgi:hypothetical protein